MSYNQPDVVEIMSCYSPILLTQWQRVHTPGITELGSLFGPWRSLIRKMICRGLGADTLFFSNDWHYWTGSGTWALKKPMVGRHDSVSFFRRASDDDLRIKNPDGT
jgi:hypothetical protein